MFFPVFLTDFTPNPPRPTFDLLLTYLGVPGPLARPQFHNLWHKKQPLVRLDFRTRVHQAIAHRHSLAVFTAGSGIAGELRSGNQIGPF